MPSDADRSMKAEITTERFAELGLKAGDTAN
jgi:hypothetical protein